MKTRQLFLVCFLLLSFAGCKKEAHFPANMTLYDKPLSVIQTAISGKWKLEYGKGGITAKTIQYYDNFYYDFSIRNRVKIINDGIVYADTTITWRNVTGIYADGASTSTMNFHDKSDYSYVYIVDKLINDTLVLHDYAGETVYYYFTKVRN